MLGGIFFYLFALVQIPLGILLDKFDPLKIIILMMLIIYIGTITLSYANSYELTFSKMPSGSWLWGLFNGAFGFFG